MKALILAAGLGSRLKPLTEKVPKAMVKFKNTEVIKHQISILISKGIEDITIVTGYKSEILKDFLENSFNHKLNFIENFNYASSNSAYSAMQALKFKINSDYIHINCDILFSGDLLSSLIKDKRKNILCVRSDLELKDSMENVISLDERVVNMALKRSSAARFKAFGLAKISKEALTENISFYNGLSKRTQRKENYFGLIRANLGKIDYFLLESNKNHLAEFNTLNELEECKFLF